MAKAVPLTDVQIIELKQSALKEILAESANREALARRKPLREFIGSTARVGVKAMRLAEDQLDELIEEGLEDKIDRRVQLAIKYGTA